MKYHDIMLLSALAALSGCASQNVSREPQTVEPIVATSSEMSTMPKARAYQTNGDYADRVMISLAPDGSILSYPAPSDITKQSAPLPIIDGWLLDRQGGVSENSAFLKYTYSEYASLPCAPTLEELKLAIIPGAKVTSVMILPFTATQAPECMDAIKEYIKDNAQSLENKAVTITRK